jgi:hypothetical protein
VKKIPVNRVVGFPTINDRAGLSGESSESDRVFDLRTAILITMPKKQPQEFKVDIEFEGKVYSGVYVVSSGTKQLPTYNSMKIRKPFATFGFRDPMLAFGQRKAPKNK